MQNSHHQLSLLLIVLFTLLQLVVLLAFGYTPYPDSDGYIQLAEECLAEHDLYPIAARLNDYPFLWNIGSVNAVVLTLKLFHSVTPLLIAYSLMKGLTAALFYQTAKAMAGEKVALIGLLLYIIYPANYGEGTSTLSELPFMFFTMTGLWLCIARKHFFAGGMAMALANWFRPMGIVFLLAVSIYLLYANRKKLFQPLLGYVAMIMVIGSLSALRTGLFLYQAKTGWMALTDYSTHHSEKSMAVRDNAEWNVSQKDAAWQSLFFDWLKEHPAEYAAQMPMKLVNTYVSDNVNMCTFISGKSDKEYMYEEVSMATLMHAFPRFSAVQWLTVVNLLVYYLILLAALASLIYLKPGIHLLPVSCILLGTLLLLLVGHGEARFHIPFMPFFMLLAAHFIHHAYGKGRVD